MIADSQIHAGANGAAGHLGHVGAGDRNVTCWCGRCGCLAAVAGLEALLGRGGDVTVDQAARTVEENPEGAVEWLQTEADAGNPHVLEALFEAGLALGRAIGDACTVLSPSVVVVGGYLGMLSGYFQSEVAAQLECWLNDPVFAGTHVVYLRTSAPRAVLGAALAAQDTCLAEPLTWTKPW